MAKAISDYGKLYASWEPYTISWAHDATDVSEVVAGARRNGVSVRVRGSAHTFSGVTLPRRGEILLRTDRLDGFSFDQPGTVVVGSGAIAWDVRDLVAQHGLLMPVYNGGWAGPTIGGYLAAGGMGLRVPAADRERWLSLPEEGRPPLLSISEMHGGFWEHVEAITLVDGTGAIHLITENDDVFPWLFGSFGQLGVFVDVRLKLMSDSGGTRPYPRGMSGQVPRVQAESTAVNDALPAAGGDRVLFWFSYLVSPRQEAGAWEELAGWVRRNTPFLRPEGGWVGPVIGGEAIGYRYLVRHRRFHPPLLYAANEDFVLMGLMTTFDAVGTARSDDRILDLERDFVGIALRNGYRLYPQAENIGRGLDYAAYYGPSTYGRFQELKARFDPDGILNPGVVFPSRIPPPQRTSVGRTAERVFQSLFGDVS